jgi:two-component system response regulator PrrA
MTPPLALIVEDDPRQNQIFSITLASHFTTEAFTDGAEALQRLADCVPALVVLDLHLPGAMGAEILARIRADQRLVSTCVILATADERQADLLSDQADVVLLKPVSPTQLRELALRLSGL